MYFDQMRHYLKNPIYFLTFQEKATCEKLICSQSRILNYQMVDPCIDHVLQVYLSYPKKYPSFWISSPPPQPE